MSPSRLGAVLSALLVLLAPVGVAAQSVDVVPDVVRRHVEAYVAAVNDDGEASAGILLEDHAARNLIDGVPKPAFVGFFSNQHRVLGGVELLDIRMQAPDRAVALLRGGLYGAPVAVAFDLEEGPERRVSQFEPGPAPMWAPLGLPVSSADFGPRASALADRGCQAGVFSGAFLVAKGAEVLVQNACGEADRASATANTVDTRFNLGSMNKMFTAVAVMQLVEAGLVSLDDPLNRYVDATWLPDEVSRKITIGQLLTHTSGLGSFLGAEFQSAPGRFRDLADYAPLVRGETPAFEPGTDYRYSNTGMLLLGVVIERASGRDYFDYVRARVLVPAGMANTGWYSEAPGPDQARAYRGAPGTPSGWRENDQVLAYKGGPAGGGFSTVGDLHRFALALLDDRLIQEASRTWLWTDHPPHNYGGGFRINQSGAGKIAGHEGIYAGVSSQLEIYVDKGYVVVILGNQDWAAPGLGDALRSLIVASD